MMSDKRALMRHMMKVKQEHIRRYLGAGMASDFSFGGPDQERKLMMLETRIYIGLNDSETRKQEYETGHYLDILKEVCRKNRVAFSVDIEEGGYYHEDGEYTEETSLVLVLIDANPEAVQNIAEELCERFHQESVLVTEDKIEGRFLYGKEKSDV